MSVYARARARARVYVCMYLCVCVCVCVYACVCVCSGISNFRKGGETNLLVSPRVCSDKADHVAWIAGPKYPMYIYIHVYVLKCFYVQETCLYKYVFLYMYSTEHGFMYMVICLYKHIFLCIW